jgi:CHAT domain-containing protein
MPLLHLQSGRAGVPVLAAGSIVAGLLLFGEASALTLEEARERCRATVGRPIVQACMRGLGYGAGLVRGGGNWEADREGCRTKARPRVKACVEELMTAVHGRPNLPVAIPEEESPAPEATEKPAAFVPPPRTIGDITAILDSETPDPDKIAKAKAEADAPPPTGASRRDLAWFYYTRGSARAQLGRLKDSIADAEQAVEVARGATDANLLSRLEQLLGMQYLTAGRPRQALAVYARQVRDADAPGARGHIFIGNQQLAMILINMGDLAQAEAYLRRSETLIREARTSGLPNWRRSYAQFGQSWEASVEATRAMIYEARGQFRKAEAAYVLAERRRRASIPGVLSSRVPAPLAQLLQNADSWVLGQARMKARQGRLAEAEVDARRALLSRLKEQGKYHPLTPKYIMGLARILIEQGRYEEAERLTRIAIEINQKVGVVRDSQSTATLLASLGGILSFRRKGKEAAEVFAELDEAIANWEPQRRQILQLNGSRIYSLYRTGRIEEGIAAAEALLKREIGRAGETHFDTAAARGTLAVGYMRAGRAADAIREFRSAIPVLITAPREDAEDEDPTLIAARRERLQNIVEAYLSLLAKTRSEAGGNIADETFGLADAVRGKSVQRALAESSARMAAKDPSLAALIRSEQDLRMQVNALFGTLSNVLALAPAERDEEGVKAINATIAKMRTDRDEARNEIARRFPSYRDFIDPKPPTADAVRGSLRQGEALLSFYFGQYASFAWVVPKDGPTAFAAIPTTADAIERKVRELRRTLEADVERVVDLPAYDLALAYELYGLLLQPFEASWMPARHLIVVTNGALGLLPLSLLPTAPAQLQQDQALPFAGYRGVPWLARTHAVTSAPSASALWALRQLPPGSAKREPLIGFGDPYFSLEQAQRAAKPIEVAAADAAGLAVRRRAGPRAASVDSAELAQLPRLPDTADELRSIARALGVDPAKVLYLGKDANEQQVKSAELSRFRIVAFSTHGLLPGDLNGLTQPALALTAPEVAGIDGDGLLTVEEILPLKLDADWVVLSACNSAAGAVAGAEAVSGLGRAFFYAGSRSLLVTNWSVDSASARDLVTDVFRRQAADVRLSRAEALRQAMMALMDGPGHVENGTTVYTYGHPMFWAPYSLIGDGGT